MSFTLVMYNDFNRCKIFFSLNKNFKMHFLSILNFLIRKNDNKIIINYFTKII